MATKCYMQRTYSFLNFLLKRYSSLTQKVSSYSIVQPWYLLGSKGVCTSSYLMKDEEVATNPFYSKYAEKIKRVQACESTPGDSDIKSQMEKFKLDRRAQVAADQFKQKIKDCKKFGMRMTSESGAKSSYKERTLDTIMHVDRLDDKTAEEISQIWREHHRTKDSVCAIVESKTYDEMMQKAKSCPMSSNEGLTSKTSFIYPLPREMGYEFMLAEFSGNQCYFTSLINYQTLGQNAPWIMVLTHFPELKDKKGIVLMVGEIDTKVLSVLEAQWLANQVQMYYASESPKRAHLLELFNHEPSKFDHMEIVNELTAELGNNKILNN